MYKKVHFFKSIAIGTTKWHFVFMQKNKSNLFKFFLKKTYKLDFGRKMELSGEIRTWQFINIFLKPIILFDNPI